MRCDKCKIEVTGNPVRCPLCQCDLTGKPDESGGIFPAVPLIVKPNRIFLSVIALISIAAVAVCFAVNLSMQSGRGWSLFVAGGIGCLWLSIWVIIKKYKNIPKTIIWQVILISGFAVLWDVFTGFHRWSLDYVLPILCICAMIAMAVIAKLRRLKASDFMIYMIIDIILGIVSLVLILCGVLTVMIPSAICVASSIVSLASLLLFEGKTMRSELRRRMHL